MKKMTGLLLRLGVILLRPVDGVRIYEKCRRSNILSLLVFLSIWHGFSSLAWAGGYVPEALWESQVINSAVLSVGVADLDGDGRENLVTLTEDQVNLWPDLNLSGTAISYKAQKHRHFHRVWTLDTNGDGMSEIILNGMKGEQIFSTILHLRDGRLETLQDFPGRLLIPWCGAAQPGMCPMLAQNQKGRWAWAGQLQEITWDGMKFVEKESLRLAGGIGWQRMTLFNLAPLDDALVVNKNEGSLELWEKGHSLWKSGLKYGGAVDVVTFGTRDPLGAMREERVNIVPRVVVRTVVEKIMPDLELQPVPVKSRHQKKPVPLPEPQFVPRGQEVITVRNDGFLDEVIGKFPRMKSTEIVQLEWTGKIISEKTVSRRFDGAISDVAVIDYDGDGLKNEVLAAFWIRQGSAVGTMGPKKSVLAVLRLK